jgi:hypothetical protein
MSNALQMVDPYMTPITSRLSPRYAIRKYIMTARLDEKKRTSSMATKLSKEALIAIAERLLNDHSLSDDGKSRLILEFEDNVPRPDAGELFHHWRHEFKDATELVEFALGQERIPKLSRDELVVVARKLMTADIENPVQSSRLSTLFRQNIPHPDGGDLIFYPKIEFKTPEELVDYALSYRAPTK